MQPFTMAVPGSDPPISTVKTIGIPRSGSTTWLCRQLGRSRAAEPFLWAPAFFFRGARNKRAILPHTDFGGIVWRVFENSVACDACPADPIPGRQSRSRPWWMASGEWQSTAVRLIEQGQQLRTGSLSIRLHLPIRASLDRAPRRGRAGQRRSCRPGRWQWSGSGRQTSRR